MQRSVRWLVLWLFVLASCGPTTVATPAPSVAVLPTATPTPTASLTMAPLATATPTPSGGMIPPTPTPPEERALAMEFTEQVSSGYATLHMQAHTCSGLRGPWEGQFEVTLTAEELQVGGTGSFAFTLPADTFYVEGEAPFSGAGTAGTVCVVASVSGPLRYEITFSPDGQSAQVVMGSYGGETITIICPDTPPVAIPFAIAWGPTPLTVPLMRYEGCR